jgi:hypothetical protein
MQFAGDNKLIYYNLKNNNINNKGKLQKQNKT